MHEAGRVRPPFPVHGPAASERDISFPRPKPRWLTLSVAYRVMHLARRLFGDRRVLRFMLNANWIFWRFSYETIVEYYGSDFCNTTYCLSSDLLRSLIPPGGSVLDIGCGGGRVCQLAAPVAGRVVGIDYDPRNIGIANAENRHAHVEYRLGDVTSVLPGERFDLAVLVAVLEHIEDVDGLLSQIHRVAPRLVVEVPDFDADLLNLVRRDLGCVWYLDADHVREYTRQVLAQHLERNGWKPIRWEFRGGMQLAVAESTLAVPHA
jgi:SAM-dependent methyltransferase